MEIHTNRKEHNMERRKVIYEELCKDPNLVYRYKHAGIYAIYIEDQLVYIGKSRNMLQRLADHMSEVEDSDIHKYQILRQAKQEGYNLRFDVFYYTKAESQEAIDLDIGYQEAYYINKYRPPLNLQVPKQNNFSSYTINETAKTITLDEVLQEYYERLMREDRNEVLEF